MLFISSCNGDADIELQPLMSEYFPQTGIRTYSIKSTNGNKSLFINEKLQGDIKIEPHFLWDSLSVDLPDKFELETYEENRKFRSFTSNGDILNIQLIQDNTDDAFEFFIEIYNHAIDNKYNFNLTSCEHFETKTKDFLVYDLELIMNGETKHVLGFISKKRNTVFYDIGHISKNPISNTDRYYFTEIINSLNDKGKRIVPNSNEIIERKSIDIHR